MTDTIMPLLKKAIEARKLLFDPGHQSAFRLLNGFYEGYPDLALDVYGRTLVVHNYADDPTQNQILVQEVISHLQATLNWLRAGTVKTRNGKSQEEKRGQLTFGDKPDTKIKEHGVWYAKSGVYTPMLRRRWRTAETIAWTGTLASSSPA